MLSTHLTSILVCLIISKESKQFHTFTIISINFIKRKMKGFLYLLSILLLVSSCTFYEPEYRGGEQFKFGKLEGKTLKFDVGAKIYNPNKYTIKIKPSDLDVYIDDDYMGVIHLDKTL